MVEERSGKKGKKKQLVKANGMDLRKYPHFLQDGDIIGVRIGAEDPEHTDDFQTDEDLIRKADFNLLKDRERAALAEAKRNKNAKREVDDVGLFINLNE